MFKKELKKHANVFKRIIGENWDRFKKAHPEFDKPQYNDPVKKMLNCGMENGGYTELLCPDCGKTRRVPFSCKSCFCLSCSKVYVDDVVEQISRVLHPGMSYRHVVLSVPEQLRMVFFRNRFSGDMMSMFMRAGYRCLESAVSRAVRKEVKIGCVMVIRTHGRSGSYNPHLHVIMTSGGIDEKTGLWRTMRFIDYEMIHKKWQYYLLSMIKAWDGSPAMLKLVDSLYRQYPNGFAANVGRGEAPQKAWGLAKYLAKYVASPPISVRRIISYDGASVTYRYSDHRNGEVTETVSAEVFVGRMVQHIMPKGFKRIRYYGLQATKSFEKWRDKIREGLLKAGIVGDAYEIVASPKYRERYVRSCGRDPLECPGCGGTMMVWKIWHPKYGVIFSEDESAYGRKWNLIG
jgi:hypothetical protein